MKVLIRDGKKIEEADGALKQSPEFKSIEADALRYSITPTTFETRQYEKDLDSWFFIEEYRCGDGHAMRFGLNDKSGDLLGKITTDKKEMGVKAGIECVYATEKASTVRSAKYITEDAKAIRLCSLEQKLINKAVEHLIAKGERAVVVDILARANGGEENGSIKPVDPLAQEKTPEIHSVVLYMNPAHTDAQSGASAATSDRVISVIDPSNFLFSSHLSNYKPQVASTTYEIKTFHKGIQIYKPGGAIGPNPDQFRDCIDLAAKLAMNFNASSTYHDLSDIKTSLLACEVVRKVANQIDTKIMDPKLPVRVKQTSDVVLIEQFYKALCMLDTNLDALKTIVDLPTLTDLTSGCKKIIAQIAGPLNSPK